MNTVTPPSILVLGLGNLLKSDDGAGIVALQRLQQDARTPRGVRLVDGGTLGLELLQYAWSCSHLLVLDAVDFDDAPGALVALETACLDWLKGGATAHDLGFADLLAAMRLVGSEPPALKLIGVQPGSTDLGTQLSPLVEKALPRLIDLALVQIQEWLRESGGPAACSATDAGVQPCA